MGSVNSVSMAYSDEDPSPKSREPEESRTVTEDSSETKKGEGEGEEERTGECEACRYIKRGECKESWLELEKCVDGAIEKEGNHMTKCTEFRMKFKACMYDNPEYYEPILTAEAEMAAMILRALRVEKEPILAGEAAAIARGLNQVREEEQPILPAEAAAIAKAFQELEAEQEEKAADGSK